MGAAAPILLISFLSLLLPPLPSELQRAIDSARTTPFRAATKGGVAQPGCTRHYGSSRAQLLHAWSQRQVQAATGGECGDRRRGHPARVTRTADESLANRHRVLDWLTEVLALQPTCTLVFRRPGGVRGVITANPTNLEHIMRASFDNYPKGQRFAALLHDFLGRGIFNADGEPWRAQRKAASYEFNTFQYAVPGFWMIKKALNLGSERRLRESIAMVHGFADRIIRSRREEMSMGCEKHDLLSRFMASQGESYTETSLRAVVISFLLAGRETTSSALTWFFWLLSSRPDVERRIRAEVAAVRARRAVGDLGRPGFDLDELREMHYVHAAITESMRLYPPVPVNFLRAEAADVLPDGTAVGAGWFVAYNSYAMGRMEPVWGEDARAYRPERWLDPAEGTFQPDSPFRYIAFHAGPRICLGKEMAYIQMKSIVACVLEEFELAVDGAYRPRQVTSLTLRMADGLPVRVKARVN
uniref:Cytochrome P450 86A2 n=1 Tax=Aegilops tauschii TaxID=37682 RepID=N1R1E5_AEGTA